MKDKYYINEKNSQIDIIILNSTISMIYKFLFLFGKPP